MTFKKAFLLSAISIIIAVFGTIGAFGFFLVVYEEYGILNEKMLEFKALGSDIVVLNDKRIKLIRNYIVTGNETSLNEYTEIINKENAGLEEKISRMKQLGLTHTQLEYINILNTDLKILISLERQALDQKKMNNEKEAIDLVYGVNYSNKDEALLKSISDLLISLDKNYQKDRLEIENESKISFYFMMIALMLIIVVSVVSNRLVLRQIYKSVKQVKSIAKNIAEGNLEYVNIKRNRDELGDLVKSVLIVKGTISSLIDNISKVTDDYSNGIVSTRIDDSLFKGEYKVLANSFNNLLGFVVNEILTMLDAFGALGNGEFSTELKQYPGEMVIVNEKFDALKHNINALNLDITKMINGATHGKLNIKANSSAYSGGWSRIIDGLNELLKSINEPIQEVNRVLSELSNGRFDLEINNSYDGTFSEMMVSLESMVKATGSYIDEITHVLNCIAEEDLRIKIDREYVGQFDLIKSSINNIHKTLHGTINEIMDSSKSVLSGARQISEGSMNLANGASSQASSIQELNSLIITINEQTNDTAKKSQIANEFSLKSMENAKSGNDEMQRMLTSMYEMKEASNNISKIIKVIDDIAFQTNLLALNAAVEAARAGQHGKGFSIVAEEVRSLASRSQKAAKSTAELIEDTISKINTGTETAQLTADSLKRIVSDINSVSDIISGIYVATREQTEGISHIAVGINEISEVVQSSSSSSEEAAAVAEELNSRSEVLAAMVEGFKL